MTLRFADPADECYDFPLTVGHLLDRALVTSGDQEIVYRDRSRYTYREFRGRIGRLASMLAGAGARQGATIAVMDWDSHRYLEAYFAIPMMGSVLQTVNVRLPVPQIAYTLAHAKAEILVIHQDFLPELTRLLPYVPTLKAIITIAEGEPADLPDLGTVAHAGEYEALSAAVSPDYPFEDFDENAVATTFYTTGTTGNPKGVCFTHRQLVLHTLAGTGPFGSTAAINTLGLGDVYMPLTPMFHVHAWGMPYIATMLGLKQVYPGRYDAEFICALRQRHGVTYSHCVPTVLQMILSSAEKTGTDLAGWKLTIGGSILSRSLCAQARAHGLDVATGYGMSETAPLVGLSHAPLGADGEEAVVDSLTSAGQPLPLVSVRIVDEAMNALPHDGVAQGELVVRAPWLTPCYTGDAQASQRLWYGGWLHTQDIATIDANGSIRIRDRLKDVIKTGGEWLVSLQLEELILSAPDVAEASVIAVPDVRWGERPLACVVPRPGATITLDVLNAPIEAAIASGAISRYGKLDRFEIVEQLPRTSVGKIDKKMLRTRFEATGGEVAQGITQPEANDR